MGSTSLWAQIPSTTPVEGIRNLPPSVTILENAKIVCSSSKTIERGSIAIRDGKILEIGTTLKAYEGARRINLEGKVLYPAWIDPYVEVEVANPDNSKGSSYWNANVVPQRDVSMLYQPNAESLTKYRKAGVGAILAVPAGGIVRGSSSLVSTNANSIEKSLIAPRVADHLRLTLSARGGGYPTSPMGAVALARQAFMMRIGTAKRGRRIELNPVCRNQKTTQPCKRFKMRFNRASLHHRCSQ